MRMRRHSPSFFDAVSEGEIVPGRDTLEQRWNMKFDPAFLKNQVFEDSLLTVN